MIRNLVQPAYDQQEAQPVTLTCQPTDELDVAIEQLRSSWAPAGRDPAPPDDVPLDIAETMDSQESGGSTNHRVDERDGHDGRGSSPIPNPIELGFESLRPADA